MSFASLVSVGFVLRSEVVPGFHSTAETVCVNQDPKFAMTAGTTGTAHILRGGLLRLPSCRLRGLRNMGCYVSISVGTMMQLKEVSRIVEYQEDASRLTHRSRTSRGLR